MKWPFFLILTMMFFLGCEEAKVEKIVYGKDYCDHCRMQINDKRFGGAFLTITGKTLKFDSVECMAEMKPTLGDDIKTVYFVDFINSELKASGNIHLYRNKSLRGPMGTQIQALSETTSLPLVQFKDVKR